jgi:hypothetical protein
MLVLFQHQTDSLRLLMLFLFHSLHRNQTVENPDRDAAVPRLTAITTKALPS